MAFIDIDEFLYSKRDKKLQDLIQELINNNPNSAGLAVNWAIFGSSGQIHKTTGLVIERFLKRAPSDFWGNEHIKTIANPRLVKDFISCHYPLFKLGCWSVNTQNRRQRLWMNDKVDHDILRLNHYFGKSRDEFAAKKIEEEQLPEGFILIIPGLMIMIEMKNLMEECLNMWMILGSIFMTDSYIIR